MNESIKKVIIFGVGVATGVATSYFILKNKYEEMYQEEIAEYKQRHKDNETDAVAKYYNDLSKKYGDPNSTESTTENLDESEPEDDESEDFVNFQMEKEPKEEKVMKKPYEITEDEFGERYEETETFTLYSDGVLVNSSGEILDHDEAERIVGKDAEDLIDLFTDSDSIFIRNDILKTDYEILRDEDGFYEEDDSD